LGSCTRQMSRVCSDGGLGSLFKMLIRKLGSTFENSEYKFCGVTSKSGGNLKPSIRVRSNPTICSASLRHLGEGSPFAICSRTGINFGETTAIETS